MEHLFIADSRVRAILIIDWYVSVFSYYNTCVGNEGTASVSVLHSLCCAIFH